MNGVMTLPTGIIRPAVRSPERWERSLAKREVFSLDAERDLALSCLDGVLWVTVDGDTHDYVLVPGQALRLARGRAATIQAIRPARFGVGRG